MKKRHSIATRIFALFVLLGVLAGSFILSNSLSMQNLANRSEALINTQLPTLVAAAKVAQVGGSITTDASNLALANTQQALSKAQTNLQYLIPELERLVESSNNHSRPIEFDSLIEALSLNIDSMAKNTQQKIHIQKLQTQLRQQLHWLQIDFVDEVSPLITESKYNLELLLEKLTTRQDLSYDEFTTLKQEITVQEQLLNLGANSNLVFDLLQRASLFNSRNDILAAQSVIDETVPSIQIQIEALKSLPSTVTIRQIAKQLNELTDDNHSTLNNGLRVLALADHNSELLRENQHLIQRVKLIINQAVSNAELQNSVNADQLAIVINNSRTQLNITLVAIASLTLLVGWYLRSQLLYRLSLVLRSMRHLANGEAQRQIHINGQDEVASLAKATNIFNQQALQLQRHSHELEEKNSQLIEEIQQRRQTEQELKDTQSDLIQAGKLAVLGQMTTGIVHEFSQPLAAIRSNSYLTEQYITKQQNDNALSKLQRINLITDRATKLCQHLKSFARKTDDITQPTSVYLALRNAIELFVDKLPPEWIENNIDTELYVSANEVRLEQVFVNLISNSIDAIQARLELDLESKPAPALAKISISAKPCKEMIKISLIDTGLGMTSHQLDNIFEPFFTTKEVGKGLGLGMSITHNIIQDFGGMIEISSSPEQGTEVTLCLKLT
ncbi:ATP-binding protein [Vibrio lamellibrachiae]|uniref:ATP-binding protein n=1 Tax=Vibrio lamellibrachiae TaxID=2910253 RepID=UPI003D1361BD